MGAMIKARLRLPVLAAIFTVLSIIYLATEYFRAREADNDEENNRLREIVASKYNELPFPSMGTLVYEEGSASRKCKMAEIRKLFSSDMAPAEICRAIYSSLSPEHWASRDGCRVKTYPYNPKDIAPTRPAYEYAGLDACIKPFPCKFGIEVTTAPKEAWGSLFMLSHYGESKAIPLARNRGKSFYTVTLHYYSEENTYARLCPGRAECECDWKSLQWWRFQDGSGFYRSD